MFSKRWNSGARQQKFNEWIMIGSQERGVMHEGGIRSNE
jgi:hypothetical protein